MRPFTEDARYEYALTADALVLDCGVYEGTFSERIARTYDCHIIGFEPIVRFYTQAKQRLQPFVKVQLINKGVAGTTRRDLMSIKGDMTGLYANNPETEEIQLRAIVEILTEINKPIDLIKINTEGAEFEILEAVLAAGLATQLRNIQVQPHTCAPDAEQRWGRIRHDLLQTHQLTFDAPWCWENYELQK